MSDIATFSTVILNWWYFAWAKKNFRKTILCFHFEGDFFYAAECHLFTLIDANRHPPFHSIEEHLQSLFSYAN